MLGAIRLSIDVAVPLHATTSNMEFSCAYLRGWVKEVIIRHVLLLITLKFSLSQKIKLLHSTHILVLIVVDNNGEF